GWRVVARQGPPGRGRCDPHDGARKIEKSLLSRQPSHDEPAPATQSQYFQLVIPGTIDAQGRSRRPPMRKSLLLSLALVTLTSGLALASGANSAGGTVTALDAVGDKLGWSFHRYKLSLTPPDPNTPPDPCT